MCNTHTLAHVLSSNSIYKIITKVAESDKEQMQATFKARSFLAPRLVHCFHVFHMFIIIYHILLNYIISYISTLCTRRTHSIENTFYREHIEYRVVLLSRITLSFNYSIIELLYHCRFALGMRVRSLGFEGSNSAV